MSETQVETAESYKDFELRQKIAILIEGIGCDGVHALETHKTLDRMLHALVDSAVFIGQDDILRPLANIKNDEALVAAVRAKIEEHFR